MDLIVNALVFGVEILSETYQYKCNDIHFLLNTVSSLTASVKYNHDRNLVVLEKGMIMC